MKLTKSQINALKEVELNFKQTHKMWETGYSLPRITTPLAEVLGNKTVLIHVPYSNFICKGSANIVDSDVKGLMPFSKTRKSEDECSTLFYGERPIERKNYIPFLSSADVYFIEKMNITEDCVEINLIKGDNAGMFM